MEYEALVKPPLLLSPRGLYWGVQRLMLKSAGRLSEGVRIGWRRGFDSGESLDYVYENRARGITPLGRMLDRVYLDSPGWKGIRQRRFNLQALLRKYIDMLLRESRPVRILDIAAGAGRYVLETAAAMRSAGISALLRDYSTANIEAGRNLAARMGVDGAVRFERGDAFDASSLAAVRPRPTLGIVSGLYELFPDNRLVSRSLAGLAEALEPGAYLIYTNQPWHPQVELIARLLVNREGRPWVMRCRPQAEMDELVRSAGFEKLEMTSDDLGIFTVAAARRD